MSPFEQQVAESIEMAWRRRWPQEGQNFIHPALVAETLAPRVAAAIELASETVATRFDKEIAQGFAPIVTRTEYREAALAALRGGGDRAP